MRFYISKLRMREINACKITYIISASKSRHIFLKSFYSYIEQGKNCLKKDFKKNP